VRRRLLGEEHFKVADSLRVLGLALLDQGRTDEAESRYGKSLAMNRTLLGNQDSRLGDTLVVLGVIYSNRGKYRESEEFFRETVDTKATGRGPSLRDPGKDIPFRRFVRPRQKKRKRKLVARLAVESGHRIFGEQYPHPLLCRRPQNSGSVAFEPTQI